MTEHSPTTPQPTPEIRRSLAGEEIAIYDDDVFAEFAGFEPGSKGFGIAMQLNRAREAIIKALWRHGAITDRGGFAIGHLADRVREFDQLSFNVNGIVGAPIMQVCIERTTKGRRTMKIELVALPRTWLRKIEGALSDQPLTAAAAAPPAELVAPILMPPPSAPAPAPVPAPVEHELASAVAAGLMAQVVEIIIGNRGNILSLTNTQLRTEIDQLTKRLGEQTGYVDRLRRDLRATQDQVIAANLERDGLRQRAQAAEYNLRLATGPDAQRLIDAELHKQVDKLMRQTPGSTKGPDDG